MYKCWTSVAYFVCRQILLYPLILLLSTQANIRWLHNDVVSFIASHSNIFNFTTLECRVSISSASNYEVYFIKTECRAVILYGVVLLLVLSSHVSWINFASHSSTFGVRAVLCRLPRVSHFHTFSFCFMFIFIRSTLSLSRPLFTWWIKQIFSQQILKASCEREGREIACHHSSNTNFYSCFISEIFLVVYFVVYFLWLESFLAVCECEALFFFVERNN